MAKMPVFRTGDLMHTITITIKTPPVTRLRMKIGLWLMKCGVLIAGFGGVRVETEPGAAALDAAGGTE